MLSLGWRNTAGRKSKPLTPLQVAIVGAVEDQLSVQGPNLAKAVQRVVQLENFRKFRTKRGEALIRQTYKRHVEKYRLAMLLL